MVENANVLRHFMIVMLKVVLIKLCIAGAAGVLILALL
jgi:hypothetical protein